MKLCVALDLPTFQENIALASSLCDEDIWLKVGFRSFIRDGADFLKALKQINPGFKIFLDLKLYDIPNTMADAAEEIASLGVDMFNLHASAGKEGMVAVMERLKKQDKRPLVLAVTALTSFDEKGFGEVYNASIASSAKSFALMAKESGLDGVVCSAFESLDIKSSCGEEFLTLSPGIRPFGEDSGDQKRVATIEFAAKAKVDFPVVGRPIYKAKEPLEQTQKIVAAITNALKA